MLFVNSTQTYTKALQTPGPLNTGTGGGKGVTGSSVISVGVRHGTGLSQVTGCYIETAVVVVQQHPFAGLARSVVSYIETAGVVVQQHPFACLAISVVS